MANNHSTLTGLFTDIADAIREKTGDTGDTLTWDGNAEWRTMVDIGHGVYMVHVSDAAPSMADFANGGTFTQLLNGASGSAEFSVETLLDTGNAIVEELVAFVVISDDNVDVDGIVFPAKGTYLAYSPDENIYISSLTIPGYTGFASKIVADNFPTAIGEIETCPEDALFLKVDEKNFIMPDDNASWYGITYGGNKFVAVVNGSWDAAYSTDGINWIETTMSGYGAWFDVAYGDGKFVAIQYNSSAAAYSTDGINWTKTTLPSSANWLRVAYGNGVFVAVIYDYNAGAAYSTDGINWISTTMPSWAGRGWSSIIYGNDKFVAISEGGSVAAYSTDGISWTKTTLPSSADWCDVTYGNGKFVAVAKNSNIAAYSTDGINWIETALSSSANWIRVNYGNDKFVAIAEMSDIVVHSIDGINWFSSIREGKILDVNNTDVTEEAVQATGLLDAELSTQDDLITQIAAALEGKTGASGGADIETCTVTISDANNYFQYIIATVFENNIISRYCSTDFNGASLNNVIKGTSVIIVSSNDIVQESSGCTIQELMITGMIAKETCLEAYITDDATIILSSSGDDAPDDLL